MPTVSVIIPNYNHARFLKRRIDSVLQQTFQDFELIILDDASTDNSREVIEFYRSHSKVKLIEYNDVNSGSPFAQWAKGIALAKTDWIWIAESDDYCDPRFLGCLASAFDQPACVLAYAETEWVDENGTVLKHGVPSPEVWNDGREFLGEKMLFEDWLVNAGMVVFRKSAAGLVAPGWQTMRQAGDYWFWCEIARQGWVYACGKVLTSFVRHSQTVSSGLLYTHTHFTESLQVHDRMFEIGSITAKQRKSFYRRQLVQLYTWKSGMKPDVFEAQFKYWIEQAVGRSIRFSDMSLWLGSSAAKMRHKLSRFRSLR